MQGKLPVLYSRTSTGAVQTWEIEIFDNKYRVTTGQSDGKKTVSLWTVCSPKNIGRANMTSPDEQAESEARAKWKKKLESGYKEHVKDIDVAEFIRKIQILLGGSVVRQEGQLLTLCRDCFINCPFQDQTQIHQVFIPRG